MYDNDRLCNKHGCYYLLRFFQGRDWQMGHTHKYHIQCSLMHLPPVAAILCPCDSLIYDRVGMNDYVLHNLQYFSLPQADAWNMPLTPTIRHSDLELDTHPKFQNEWQGSLW